MVMVENMGYQMESKIPPLPTTMARMRYFYDYYTLNRITVT